MPAPTKKIEAMVMEILAKRSHNPKEIDPKASIYSNGLGLDSLDVATLSVRLEREFGYEPFSQGIFPQSVEEIAEFYEKRDSK